MSPAIRWINPCFSSIRHCSISSSCSSSSSSQPWQPPKLPNSNPFLSSKIRSSNNSLSWRNPSISRPVRLLSHRVDHQPQESASLSQDDITYLWKLAAGSVLAAAVIKYGSVLFPMIAQPNLSQAFLMISAPVLVSFLILIKESIVKNDSEDM